VRDVRQGLEAAEVADGAWSKDLKRGLDKDWQRVAAENG